MKLRNKKTGEIGELHYYPDKEYHFAVSAKDPTQTGIYKTLGEILQDWTDFIVHEPTESLIEDEKARKVFREWADLFGAKRFRVDHLCSFCRTVITSNDLVEEPAIELPGFIGKDSETYTKVELCGEEEDDEVQS